MKKLILISLISLGVGTGLGYLVGYDIGYEKAIKKTSNSQQASINSYKDCVDAGYPVQESYPEVCTVGNKRFVNPNQSVSPPNL